jgi:hypothetical protein
MMLGIGPLSALLLLAIGLRIAFSPVVYSQRRSMRRLIDALPDMRRAHDTLVGQELEEELVRIYRATGTQPLTPLLLIVVQLLVFVSAWSAVTYTLRPRLEETIMLGQGALDASHSSLLGISLAGIATLSVCVYAYYRGTVWRSRLPGLGLAAATGAAALILPLAFTLYLSTSLLAGAAILVVVMVSLKRSAIPTITHTRD